MNSINRRSMMKTSALMVGGTVLGMSNIAGAECPAAKGACKMKRYENDHYYDKDGNFLVEKARQAYYEMMERFHYPIPDILRTAEFWAVDFGLGDFANVGMAGIIWVNVEKYSYFGHDIYLLPGQMIPEHHHIKTAFPCKMESWQVRYGSVYNWSEGEPTVPPISKPAESQKDIVHCKHCELLNVGDVSHLEVEESWHFLQGGPEGTIVTEYARYHDGAGVKFSNPKAQF
ncbi:MAG: hypothetical protein Q4D98_07515 [Planctomycetia bacterium]|nr:hypothetical protein [Planctomycetia bacterium]